MTVRVTVVVCEINPDVPVTVMVEAPTFAVLAAVNVICPEAPGFKLRLEGIAVIPAGSPFKATVTGEVKPLIPFKVN